VSPGDAEAQWDLLVDHYRKLMAHAERSGVKVALHTGGALGTSQALDRLMREVPSPYNGVCFCTGNSWRSEGEGIYDMIRRLGEKVFHVHLRNVRIVPGDPHDAQVWFGSGQPDLRKVVQALRDIDYSGDLHAEHLPGVVGERDEEIRTAFAIGYMSVPLLRDSPRNVARRRSSCDRCCTLLSGRVLPWYAVSWGQARTGAPGSRWRRTSRGP
jgi:sugar phosphate isomerase/epimerase